MNTNEDENKMWIENKNPINFFDRYLQPQRDLFVSMCVIGAFNIIWLWIKQLEHRLFIRILFTNALKHMSQFEPTSKRTHKQSKRKRERKREKETKV